jgi:hypothetical protein
LPSRIPITAPFCASRFRAASTSGFIASFQGRIAVQEPALPKNVIECGAGKAPNMGRFPEKRKCAAFAVS